MRAILIALLLCLVAPSTGQAQSLDEAMAGLKSPNAEVRTRAACTLSRFRAQAQPAISALIANLGDDTIVPHNVCREILGTRGYRGYADPRGTSPAREAARALGHIGPSALGPLHAALSSDDPVMRLGVVRALNELEDTASVPVLVDLLPRDADPEIRAEIASALGSIEDPRAVPALGAALSDSQIMVREQAAWALGSVESREGVSFLITALSDSSPLVRERASWALGSIEDTRAVEALVVLLSDVDPAVREQAAWALGSIGDDKAIDALIALMDDHDVEVRRMATWALSALD